MCLCAAVKECWGSVAKIVRNVLTASWGLISNVSFGMMCLKVRLMFGYDPHWVRSGEMPVISRAFR